MFVLAWFTGVVASAAGLRGPAESGPLPNIIIFFIDDMGYADIGPFGVEEYSTPNLDRMAREGRVFTDFIVSSPVCSASRAALMTGCFNRRVGIQGALFPNHTHGLNPSETTLAEICRQRGYATACYGKWHLGHHPKFLPPNHGFDEYLGIPYSNDMWPLNPKNQKLPEHRRFPPLPLIEGTEVVDPDLGPEDQQQFTRLFTQRAVSFIERHREQPFFIYLPHPMVHVPLYASEAFEGRSGAGLYGDVVMELDWSVGRILDTLERHGLDRETLVVFTSDNGPWLAYGDHAGSAGPLREGKLTAFEGGIREPTVCWWPGRIPAGTECDELASTIDLLPTVAALIGAELPEHRIDGKDIAPLLFGTPGAESPHEAFPIYYRGHLHAIREDRWKVVFPHTYSLMEGREAGRGGVPRAYAKGRAELALYDLDHDIGEATDVKDRYPEIFERLTRAADRYRADLGDGRNRGPGIRNAASLNEGDPRLTW
ncbi:Arylsulfatase [Kiritimatiella glycovorans]|uniref:Arylsulfatase n=2 Tax=Kiritimatiella glycovorans TaxID=1307763 RepID=A0A0G3EIQ6_9BACT|nr:Arylsulfatase [Kiritimatiella glycovorans]